MVLLVVPLRRRFILVHFECERNITAKTPGVTGNFDDHGFLTTIVRGCQKSLKFSAFLTKKWVIIEDNN